MRYLFSLSSLVTIFSLSACAQISDGDVEFEATGSGGAGSGMGGATTATGGGNLVGNSSGGAASTGGSAAGTGGAAATGGGTATGGAAATGGGTATGGGAATGGSTSTATCETCSPTVAFAEISYEKPAKLGSCVTYDGLTYLKTGQEIAYSEPQCPPDPAGRADWCNMAHPEHEYQACP